MRCFSLKKHLIFYNKEVIFSVVIIKNLKMRHITNLAEYCTTIKIPLPKHPHFDIRRFEDNMKTVNLTQEPFKHEFYALALKLCGSNRQVMGKNLTNNLFFNTPYQVITWEIDVDWQGWYIIFTEEFVRSNPIWANFLVDFPFLRLDKSIPFDVSESDALFKNSIFEQIFAEYHSNHDDKFSLIATYVNLLLLRTRRCFNALSEKEQLTMDNRTSDILLVSRFQTLVERSFGVNTEGSAALRSASFYAEKLIVHPNHLNAVVKRITGKTASQVIQEQLILQAKSLLQTTEMSIKEIAYQMGFDEPTHFNAFFKKITQLTPASFRKI
jgi:AraC family transcriptional regulator, transcriptional activator of pobA